jgi:hypothetical protein
MNHQDEKRMIHMDDVRASGSLAAEDTATAVVSKSDALPVSPAVATFDDDGT